jgi:hypothetical protein
MDTRIIPARKFEVISVSRFGDCVNVEIGYEEEATLAVPSVPNEVMQHVVQLIHSIISTKRRITKATICLTEEEYEILKPAVGDEVEAEIKNGTITFKFAK